MCKVTDRSFLRRQEDLRNKAGGARSKISPWSVWLYGLPAVAMLGGILHLNGLGPFQSLKQGLDAEATLKEEIGTLRTENDDLESEIDSLGTGQFGIEKRAREDLGWSKPGEIVIHLPDKR